MSDSSLPRYLTDRPRPVFPRRAVVTAGMPYGNKDLHFGHVGGVFVHADAFARFLRDRLGPENVIFVSGTDGYGSPIVADHARRVEAGEFSGSLEEFVRANHERQSETLAAYSISLNLFAASSMSPWREIHAERGAWILETLHANGHLRARSTPQPYDEEAGTFLSGRQVIGRCPIEGCRAEKAYADECSLGHQYDPAALVDPRSALTGNRPALREVTNWYILLEELGDGIRAWIERLREEGRWRDFMIRTLLEHFEAPTIHVLSDEMEAVEAVRDRLPPHREEEGRSKSVRLVFDSLAEMDAARAVLDEQAIRIRTGKTLVPFRLTGNLEWGLAAPDIEGLTFWVWPESLWAPISFTISQLERTGADPDRWTDWWCRRDAEVYQFIGEDNLFFYGLGQAGIWLGMQGPEYDPDPPDGALRMTHLVANRHLLFLGKKASSSGKVKPPMARDLLDHYTADQLRIHFLSLALGHRNGRFRPLPLDPSAKPGAPDPVLREGNLLSNALNRAVRSCFYTAQKFFENRVPRGEVDPEVGARCEETILDFEEAFSRHDFPAALSAVGGFIREINSRWGAVNPYRDDCDPDARRQALVDAFQMVRIAVVLLHPVAPVGTERVREALHVGEEFFRWDRIFEPILAFFPDPAAHEIEEIPPRTDFFEKHPSQLA